MNYMEQIEAWLAELLPPLPNEVDVKRAIKAKLLESYRNGQRDCRKCNPQPRRKGVEATA